MNIDVLRTAILTSVAAGPQHGYAILRDVQTLSDGRISPQVGSLYRAIDHLVRDGLLIEHSNSVVDGRFRRDYAITPDGQDELLISITTMSTVVTQARRRLKKGNAALATGAVG